MSEYGPGYYEAEETGGEVFGTQSLTRGIRALLTLSQAPEPLGVAELAVQIEAPESTMYRIVQALEQNGFVERSERGRIVPGLRLLDLARAVEKDVEAVILHFARPVMRDLAMEVKETVMLTAHTGLYSICLESIESPRAIRLSMERGRVLPMYSGASGKILLAHLGSRVVARAVSAANGVLRTNGEVISAGALEEELGHIRDLGYCTSEGEIDADVAAAAAPVLRGGGRPPLGLTIAGPSQRLPVGELDSVVATVIKASREIERRLEAATIVG
ncbi:IclR family transcriptional regulator [soil metagenome]